MNKYISFGAGVNSVAMTIMLFKRGEICSVIFADTGAERPETYCYIDYFEKEFMRKYNQRIIRISPKDTPEYYPPAKQGLTLEEFCLKNKKIPFLKGRFCTSDYKRDPLMKYKRLHSGKDYIEYIGFALDEKHRARANPYNAYPLIEEKITRSGCLEIIKNEGLLEPIKSGCFFCPFQRLSDWEHLYRKHPDLFNRASALEQNASYKNRKTLRSDLVSLETLRRRFEGKGGELFADYDYEELTPCICLT